MKKILLMIMNILLIVSFATGCTKDNIDAPVIAQSPTIPKAQESHMPIDMINVADEIISKVLQDSKRVF